MTIRCPPAGLTQGGKSMLDASYYSVIERTPDGRFVAWVPDVPGIAITGDSEAEVIGGLTRTIRQCVRDMIIDGKPVPRARSIDDLPAARAGRRLHRMLLVIG